MLTKNALATNSFSIFFPNIYKSIQNTMEEIVNDLTNVFACRKDIIAYIRQATKGRSSSSIVEDKTWKVCCCCCCQGLVPLDAKNPVKRSAKKIEQEAEPTSSSQFEIEGYTSQNEYH